MDSLEASINNSAKPTKNHHQLTFPKRWIIFDGVQTTPSFSCHGSATWAEHAAWMGHFPFAIHQEKRPQYLLLTPKKKQRLPSNHPLHFSSRSCSSCMALRIGTIQSSKIVRALAATFLHSTFWNPNKKKNGQKAKPQKSQRTPPIAGNLPHLKGSHRKYESISRSGFSSRSISSDRRRFWLGNDLIIFPGSKKRSGNPRFLKALVFASRVYISGSGVSMAISIQSTSTATLHFFGARRLPKISKISTLSNYSKLLVPIFQFPHFNCPPQ